MYYLTEVAYKNGLQVYVPVSEPFTSFASAMEAKKQLDDDGWNSTWVMDEVQLFKKKCYIIMKCSMINHTGPHTEPEWIFSRTEMLRKGGAVKWFFENYPEQEWHPNVTFYRLYWVTANGHYKLLAER